jgi:hypothetical protein
VLLIVLTGALGMSDPDEQPRVYWRPNAIVIRTQT